MGGLSRERRAELENLLRSDFYDGSVACRAEFVLRRDEGVSVVDIAARVGTFRPTVYRWLELYDRDGVDGLVNRVSTGRPPGISAGVRGRIVALTRTSPPDHTDGVIGPAAIWRISSRARRGSSCRIISFPSCSGNMI